MLFSAPVCIFAGALIMASSIAFTNLKIREGSRVDATPTKQLFVQVRNDTELLSGDKVIIAHNDRAIYGLGGNPVFTSTTNIAGGSADGSMYYFESTSAMIMEVGSNSSCYTFKSLRTPAEESNRWLKTSGKYLAYAAKTRIDGYDYGYTEDGINIQTKGDVIFKAAIDEYSSLNVDFDERGFVYLTRENEPNRYGLSGENEPISIQYTSSYAEGGYFGYFFGNSNVRLYRQVDLSKGVDIYIKKHSDKSHYLPNETTDLTGLEIDVTFNDTYDTYTCKYEDQPEYFTALTADYETKEARFKWCGFSSYYTAEVDIPREGEHYYSKVLSTGPIDDRGTYFMSVDVDGNTRALDLNSIPRDRDSAAGIPLVTLGPRSDYFCDKNDLNEFIPEVTNNLFKIVYDTDGYYIKIDNKYLSGYDTGHDYYSLYLGIRQEAFKVRIGLNGTIETINNDRFSYSPGVNKVYVNKYGNAPSEPDMVLYKMDMSDSDYEQISGFKELFYDKTASVSNANWNDLKEAFDDLLVDGQGYLASLTYNHSQEVEYSFNHMADRYDYLVKQYKYEDFMARGAAGTLENYYLRDVVSDINTFTMFRYDYQQAEEGYTFANVAIRYGAFISKELWDEIDEEFGITGFGVIHSTNAYLEGQTLEYRFNLLNTNNRTVDEALDLLCDGNDIKKASVNSNLPSEATSEQKAIMGIEADDIYYTWNLRKNIDSEKYNTYYNAVSYIRINDGILFLGEASESAKHLAATTLDKTDELDPSYDSLQYFVNN